MLLYLYYDTTMMKDPQDIKTEIDRIKKALSNLDRMRPGSLSTQKRDRGGEYYQLSYSHDGKGHTEYVQEKDVPALKQELENYRKFRELITRWVGLEIELAGIGRKRSRLKKHQEGHEREDKE
jgi:hypothetical protein